MLFNSNQQKAEPCSAVSAQLPPLPAQQLQHLQPAAGQKSYISLSLQQYFIHGICAGTQRIIPVVNRNTGNLPEQRAAQASNLPPVGTQKCFEMFT